MTIKPNRETVRTLLTQCINVVYAYERRAFKHVEPKGGGLTEDDLDTLQHETRKAFLEFFDAEFEFE